MQLAGTLAWRRLGIFQSLAVGMTMARFELITSGMNVGYGPDGFFAWGISTAHDFDGEWNDESPPIQGMPVHWAIRLSEEDPFERYVSSTYPPSGLSPRVPMLRDFFTTVQGKAVGKMHRWDPKEPIDLSYYLPNDPSLAAFIMGAATAGRELTIWSQGWRFLVDDDHLAPAPSIKGFMERMEPAFVTEMPTITVK